MPIGTPTTLGSTANSANTSSYTHSTTATVTGTSDTLVFVTAAALSQSGTIPTLSMSGTLTWTKDKEQTGTASALGWSIAQFSAPAPSGLASSTTLTLSTGTPCFNGFIAADYSTGLDTTGSRTDGTDGRFRTSPTTSWDTQGGTAPTTSVADTLLRGGAFADAITTSSVSSPIFEIADFQEPTDGQTMTSVYQILSSTGAVRLTGTWAAGPAAMDATCVVAYKAAAGGAPATDAPGDPWVAHAELGPGDYGPNPFVEVLPPITTTGPQTFLQALTATTVTTTASIVKQVGKIVSATATITASFVKQVNKALTATTVALTATMVALKVILKTLTATTVTTTATIVKQVNKFLTATTIALTASIVKQVNKLLTATTVALTASLNAIKVILRTLTATTVSLTATMVRQVGKPLTATTVALTASVVKRVNKALTATTVALTATMTAIKVILRTLTATTVTTTATMTRRVGTAVTATATVSASIAKRVGKTISGAISNVASLVAQFFGPPTQDLYPTPFEYTEQHNDLTYQEQTGLTYREPRKFTGN